MTGENNLAILLKSMKPQFNAGDYVFCLVSNPFTVPLHEVIALFKETEGYTLILEKKLADHYQLSYQFVAAWITLTVHSALDAVGLTAAFSTALSEEGISCNVLAAFHHDHIFVGKDNAHKAMEILCRFSD